MRHFLVVVSFLGVMGCEPPRATEPEPPPAVVPRPPTAGPKGVVSGHPVELAELEAGDPTGYRGRIVTLEPSEWLAVDGGGFQVRRVTVNGMARIYRAYILVGKASEERPKRVSGLVANVRREGGEPPREVVELRPAWVAE